MNTGLTFSSFLLYLESFDNLFQQDAHEFLNYLLNTCADILKEEMKELRRLDELKMAEMAHANNSGSKLNMKAYRALSSKQPNGSAGNSNNNQGGFIRNGSSTGSNRSMSSKNSANSKAASAANANQNEVPPVDNAENNNSTSSSNKEELTWIHELFQGILVNETKCLNCETVSWKAFLFILILT
jgi:hypothetical protein